MDVFGIGEKPLIFVSLEDESENFVSGQNVRGEIMKPSGIIQNITLQELIFLPGHYFFEFTDADETGIYLYEISAEGFESEYGSFLVKRVTEGMGLSLLEVHAKYEDGSPVGGALISFYNLTDDFLAYRITNANGIATIRVENGSYKIRGFSDNAFFEPLLVNVSGDVVVDYYGIKTAVRPLMDPRLIRVYGFLKDINLSPDRSYKAFITAELAHAPSFVDKTLLTVFPLKAFIDRKTGFFYMDIVKGISVFIICDEAHLRRLVEIPSDRDLISLKELLNL